MGKRRILVVDDEQDLCEILLYNLTTAGYEAEAAYSAEEALKKGIVNFDLLLLDVMMSGMSGFEMAELIKNNEKTAHIPIIFLTAKDTEDDTLQGFDIGADDYVKKPFSVREVMARVGAVIGRVAGGNASKQEKLSFEGLIIDDNKKTVIVDGEEVLLTKTEFELLGLLLRNRGKVLSRTRLLEEVWPKDVIVTNRTVDVNITRLRKKIGKYSACIVARQGFGYSFKDDKKMD